MCILAGYNFLIKHCYFFEVLHYAVDTKEYLIKDILLFIYLKIYSMKRAMLIVMLLLPLYSIAQDKNLEILQEAIDGRDPASITELYLSYKGLTSLPSEIGKLQNLSYLYIYDNDIPEAERQKIESWLPNCEIIWEEPED